MNTLRRWLHHLTLSLLLQMAALALVALLVYLSIQLVRAPKPAYIPQYRTCADFATQAEAQDALPLWPRLDGDRDGVACEKLP